ncbi:tyrosine-type recombinase/integrase [Lysinibacillus boronitolerans]|uniref:tyrosine-type recombinase/integrase n=1 Tax=Lysinibacillus boronitolerans TaxID=309788 RepID=UPI00385344BF
MLIQDAIDEFLLYLEVEKNCSYNTVVGYEYDLNNFVSFLQSHKRSLDVNDINKALVRRFIQERVKNDHLSAASIHRQISALRSLAKYCVNENILESNFMNGIEKPKLDKKLPIYMTLQELRRFLTYLESYKGRFAMRNKVMFTLLATTGMRRQELVELTWGQIDLDNAVVRIFGKGKKERIVPLHPIVIPMLQDFKYHLPENLIQDSNCLFLNKNGKQLNPRGLHKVFKDTLNAAGMDSKRFSLHHLRHTFATLLLQENSENVDLRVIQELLGHTSLLTTQVYTHVNYEQKQKAVTTFNIFN